MDVNNTNNKKRLVDKAKIALIVSAAVTLVIVASVIGTINAVKMDHDKTQADTQVTTLSDENTNGNKPQMIDLDGIIITFETEPKDLRALALTSIKMTISDKQSGKPITHVDWSVIIRNNEGKEVYKSNTLHSHVGVQHFNYTFPEAGEYTISVQVASLGPKMMDMDVPAMAQTRVLLSGDPMDGWKTDPNLFFGTRNTEFKVNVGGQGGIKIVNGTEPGTRIAVELATDPKELVAGQPVTLMINVKNADDGSDVTHVEARVNVVGALLPSISTAPPMGSDMMPMLGSLHGHTGQMAFTTIFPISGKYIVRIDLNSLPVSNYMFGQASTRFILGVSDTALQKSVINTSRAEQNQIVILGQDPPFYSPNNIIVKAGTTITVVNKDPIIHTLTATSDDIDVLSPTPNNAFDTGLLRFGEEKQIKLDRPGTYNYFCTLHPFMRGSITVTE